MSPSVPTGDLTLESDRTADGTEVSTVVAELPTGTVVRLRIADHFMLVSELRGIERELTILAHPTEVAKQEVLSPRIAPPEVWYSPWTVDLYGIVEAVDVEPTPSNSDHVHVLDVGVGSIYLHPTVSDRLPESDRPLRKGDELYLPSAELTMWELHP